MKSICIKSPFLQYHWRSVLPWFYQPFHCSCGGIWWSKRPICHIGRGIVLSWESRSLPSFNFLTTPMKFVPLSKVTVLANYARHFKKLFLSRESAASRWTALTLAKQTSTSHSFSSLRFFTNLGPIESEWPKQFQLLQRYIHILGLQWAVWKNVQLRLYIWVTLGIVNYWNLTMNDARGSYRLSQRSWCVKGTGAYIEYTI